jgi:hypothetical protein
MTGDVVLACTGGCTSGGAQDPWCWLAATDDETTCSRCGHAGVFVTAVLGPTDVTAFVVPDSVPELVSTWRVIGPADAWPAPYLLVACRACSYERVGTLDESCPSCDQRVAAIVAAQRVIDRRRRREAA